MPVGILKRKIKPWNLPQLLLIITLLLMHVIINAKCNYCISNKLIEDCDKEENLEVTGGVATSCLKRRL
jgi:hypothetical protein